MLTAVVAVKRLSHWVALLRSAQTRGARTSRRAHERSDGSADVLGNAWQCVWHNGKPVAEHKEPSVGRQDGWMDVGLANGAEGVIVKRREKRWNVRTAQLPRLELIPSGTLSSNLHHVLHDHTR